MQHQLSKGGQATRPAPTLAPAPNGYSPVVLAQHGRRVHRRHKQNSSRAPRTVLGREIHWTLSPTLTNMGQRITRGRRKVRLLAPSPPRAWCQPATRHSCRPGASVPHKSIACNIRPRLGVHDFLEHGVCYMVTQVFQGWCPHLYRILTPLTCAICRLCYLVVNFHFVFVYCKAHHRRQTVYPLEAQDPKIPKKIPK